MAKKKVHIALYNMGGPESVDDVPRFLNELFLDNDLLGVPSIFQKRIAKKIVTARVGEVQERYKMIGGKSPQLGITNSVSKILRERITALGNFEVTGVSSLMRYSAPRSREIIEACHAQGADELWLLSQYPHCTRATTGSSLRELALSMRSLPTHKKIAVRTFLPLSFLPEFSALWARRIQTVWNSLGDKKKFLLISAHGLPKSYIAQGDPYAMQTYQNALDVCRQIGLREGLHWMLAWQSVVGKAKWLTPYTPDALKMIRDRGFDTVLVWPISFVSDHIETLHEIDIEYKELAHQLGFQRYARVPNLNDDSDYTELLKKLVEQGAQELTKYGETPLLRNLETSPVGEGCTLQPGGCLCARYYHGGKKGELRGVNWEITKP